MVSVKRSSVYFFIRNWSWKISQITRTLTIQKINSSNFKNFSIFRLRERILFRIFYDLAVSRNPLSENLDICEILSFDIFNCGIMCDLTNVPSWIYDRKIDARPFHAIHDILRWLSLVQSLLDRNASIWRKLFYKHIYENYLIIQKSSRLDESCGNL